MAFNYVEGMEPGSATKDYSERLARRTGITEDILKGKQKVGHLSDAEALEMETTQPTRTP